MQVHTHIMFQGQAEEALALYSKVFDDFRILEVERYGPGEACSEGALKLARVSFCGHSLLIFDSPPIHDFSFTPAMSLFVDFESVSALDAAFEALSEGGQVLMPLGDYGFSRRFGWITDRFGVSWQLNRPR